MWYLTGTIPPFWPYNQGIKIWRSRDMISWEPLGMVWRYGSSPWHKKFLEAKKPLWAPEIHYLKGTFWLTYSMPGWDGTAKTFGSGLLKSLSGRREGPYQDVQPAERLGDGIDASLFQDDDGAVYFLWHSGKIARMKDDMSGLAEPYHWLRRPAPTRIRAITPSSAAVSSARTPSITSASKGRSCSRRMENIISRAPKSRMAAIAA